MDRPAESSRGSENHRDALARRAWEHLLDLHQQGLLNARIIQAMANGTAKMNSIVVQQRRYNDFLARRLLRICAGGQTPEEQVSLSASLQAACRQSSCEPLITHAVTDLCCLLPASLPQAHCVVACVRTRLPSRWSTIVDSPTHHASIELLNETVPQSVSRSRVAFHHDVTCDACLANVK